MFNNKFLNRISKINLFILILINLISLFINRLFSFKIVNLMPEQQIPLNIKYFIIFLNEHWYLIFIVPFLYFTICISNIKKYAIEKTIFILSLFISILILLINFIAPIIYIFPFH